MASVIEGGIRSILSIPREVLQIPIRLIEGIAKIGLVVIGTALGFDANLLTALLKIPTEAANFFLEAAGKGARTLAATFGEVASIPSEISNQ